MVQTKSPILADRSGSLDVGKNANVVIADRDPLDVSTGVKQIFLKGLPVEMKSPQAELRDKYTKDPKS
jgi:imidazolonepropionase-like amidohydrolase